MLENLNIVQMIIGAWVVWCLVPLLLGLVSCWLNVVVREDKYSFFISFQDFKFRRIGPGWGVKSTSDGWFSWLFLDLIAGGVIFFLVAFLCVVTSPYLALVLLSALASPFVVRTLLDLKKGLAYSAETGKLKRLEEIEQELQELKKKGV